MLLICSFDASPGYMSDSGRQVHMSWKAMERRSLYLELTDGGGCNLRQVETWLLHNTVILVLNFGFEAVTTALNAFSTTLGACRLCRLCGPRLVGCQAVDLFHFAPFEVDIDERQYLLPPWIQPFLAVLTCFETRCGVNLLTFAAPQLSWICGSWRAWDFGRMVFLASVVFVYSWICLSSLSRISLERMLQHRVCTWYFAPVPGWSVRSLWCTSNRFSTQTTLGLTTVSYGRSLITKHGKASKWHESMGAELRVLIFDPAVGGWQMISEKPGSVCFWGHHFCQLPTEGSCLGVCENSGDRQRVEWC